MAVVAASAAAEEEKEKEEEEEEEESFSCARQLTVRCRSLSTEIRLYFLM
jgi:hypothetical protein